jgi:hypothetical protein
MHGPPKKRKGPLRVAPQQGPIQKITRALSTSAGPVGQHPCEKFSTPSLLTMASRLVDDGTTMTPVRAKIAAARIVDRLRRQLPVSDEEAGAVHQLYRQRRAELLAAAEMFSGCT